MLVDLNTFHLTSTLGCVISHPMYQQSTFIPLLFIGDHPQEVCQSFHWQPISFKHAFSHALANDSHAPFQARQAKQKNTSRHSRDSLIQSDNIFLLSMFSPLYHLRHDYFSEPIVNYTNTSIYLTNPQISINPFLSILFHSLPFQKINATSIQHLFSNRLPERVSVCLKQSYGNKQRSASNWLYLTSTDTKLQAPLSQLLSFHSSTTTSKVRAALHPTLEIWFADILISYCCCRG